MKIFFKKLFLKWNIYYLLKYSSVYKFYAQIFRRDIITAEKREIAFYKSFLGNCDLVFDIGAYDGHKTEAFLYFAKKVICCEPDENNFFMLSKRFSHSDKVIVKQTALSNKNGVEKLFVHYPGSAFNTLNTKWKEILEKEGEIKFNEKFHFEDSASVNIPADTLDNLIFEFGKPDFIKIDVEGYEKNVLWGLSSPVKCLSIEANLPYFFSEISECLEMLYRLDVGVLFNYSTNEKLQLPEFINYENFMQIFSGLTDDSYEIICKMNQ